MRRIKQNFAMTLSLSLCLASGSAHAIDDARVQVCLLDDAGLSWVNLSFNPFIAQLLVQINPEVFALIEPERCSDRLDNDCDGEIDETECEPIGGVCGNGVVEGEEECDSGSPDGSFDCTPECRISVCGNGIVEPGENCDDGNSDESDGCPNDCVAGGLPLCGNGRLDAYEECDDGNTVGGDGCSENCTFGGECGDAVVDFGEECDDGNRIDGDGCTQDCRIPEFDGYCGDGVVQFAEECDDANQDDGDGCSSSCRIENALAS